MKDKNEYVNKLINECLKIIVNNKVKMIDLAFEMGINLIDLYKLFVDYNHDLSCYLELLYLLQ